MAAAKTLTVILVESGVPDEAKDYLLARGITTPAILALCGNDAAEFGDLITDKFIAGCKIKGVDLKFSGDPLDQVVLRATMQVAYEACKTQQQMALSATMLSLAPPASTATAASGTTISTTTTKIPTTLPTGVWAAAVQKWNKIQTGGIDRSFPCNILIGAEKVLARIHHEITVSRVFTPVLLGEIMTTRAYTSTGQINIMAQKKPDRQEMSLEDGQWVAQEPKPWDPSDLMAVLDGLESIRWAWILFDMGNECDINDYMEWFIRLAKDRKDRLHQVKALWLAANWRFITEMRQGSTFLNAVQSVRADTEWVQDRLNQARKGPKGKTKGSDSRQNSRGRGAAKGQGRGRTNSIPAATSWNRPRQTEGYRTCDSFNRGRCRFGDNCRDAHKCSICGRDNHGANNCHQNKGGKGEGGKGGKGGKDRSRSGYRGKGEWSADQAPTPTIAT